MTVQRSEISKAPLPTEDPILAGYQKAPDTHTEKDIVHASLWTTLAGSDGYYPLGIVSHCASDRANILPSLVEGTPRRCTSPDAEVSDELQQFERMPAVHPSLPWTMLSVVLGLYCLAHTALLWVARFWSPFTRDLAISENDRPRRRSVYMNIGASMLFSIAWVLEWPVFAIHPAFRIDHLSLFVSVVVLLAAGLAVISTWSRTWRYTWYRLERKGKENRAQLLQSDRAGYLLFNAVATITVVLIPGVWCWICQIDLLANPAATIHTKYGIFFSYRCLHPTSGVSPVVPVFLVLLGWYLWAICQTYRLRFSDASRPRLPGDVITNSPVPLFVSDHTLDECNKPQQPCLFNNIGCLLITRELLQRFRPQWKGRLTLLLAAMFAGGFFAGVRFNWIQSVDRLLLQAGARRPTLYEALLTGLLVPLGMIALAGWLRAILVWGALRRGLLEPLERYPLRAAFTRLKGLGWMAMMRDTGLHLRWKDMARTSESIRQLLHNDEIKAATSAPSVRFKLDCTGEKLRGHLEDVGKLAHGDDLEEGRKKMLLATLGKDPQRDLPQIEHLASLAGIHAIEMDYAAFCEVLLQTVLIPYWLRKSGGFVEGEGTDVTPIHARRKQKTDEQKHDPIELHTGSNSVDPEYIQLAEELLALRYVSLIRAVLGNLRYLMTFVAAVFVIMIVAWNSYPFEPRQVVDWMFTLVFLLLGGGMLWVLTQMHRNAILSRITDTSPNELGLDFYWRLATFGAIPFLTWLAYQFPQIGSEIFRILQPGIGVAK
jgi:hypothetical protein